jgi:hypothetical protein
VHLTETCEAERPHLLIHVATTPAPNSDVGMIEAIQAHLQQAQMLLGTEAGDMPARSDECELDPDV